MPVLDDEDTLWEISQECVSRCDCQLNSNQAAALLHPNFCCIMGSCCMLHNAMHSEWQSLAWHTVVTLHIGHMN